MFHGQPATSHSLGPMGFGTAWNAGRGFQAFNLHDLGKACENAQMEKSTSWNCSLEKIPLDCSSSLPLSRVSVVQVKVEKIRPH